MPVDYESLAEAGSIMGSGGMIVMDDGTCMVDVAKYFHGLLPGRVLRQVPAVPGRAPMQMYYCLTEYLPGRSQSRRPGPARTPGRHGPQHQPVRARPGRPQPGVGHPALFPRTSTWHTSTTGCARQVPARSEPGRRPRPSVPSRLAPALTEGLMSVRTLVIDGQDVAGYRPTRPSVQVAAENGIVIPTLCHLDGLVRCGCLPAVRGRGGGQRQAPRRLRDHSRGGHEGVTTSERSLPTGANGRAVFSWSATTSVRCAWPTSTASCRDEARSSASPISSCRPCTRWRTVDASHERFVMDQNRCILCTRCVRVCDEIEGAHTWDIRVGGPNARLVTDLGTPWGESTTCTSCGKCVQVCPTGALFEKGRSVAEAKPAGHILPYL